MIRHSLQSQKTNLVDLVPGAKAPEYLHEIYRFALAEERRWLAPKYLQFARKAAGSKIKINLCRFVV
jgi:hypothetical protein